MFYLKQPPIPIPRGQTDSRHEGHLNERKKLNLLHLLTSHVPGFEYSFLINISSPSGIYPQRILVFRLSVILAGQLLLF